MLQLVFKNTDFCVFANFSKINKPNKNYQPETNVSQTGILTKKGSRQKDPTMMTT